MRSCSSTQLEPGKYMEQRATSKRNRWDMSAASSPLAAGTTRWPRAPDAFRFDQQHGPLRRGLLPALAQRRFLAGVFRGRGELDLETRSVVRIANQADVATVALNDAAADGKTHLGCFRLSVVQEGVDLTTGSVA